jgi:hypothetical protein
MQCTQSSNSPPFFRSVLIAVPGDDGGLSMPLDHSQSIPLAIGQASRSSPTTSSHCSGCLCDSILPRTPYHPQSKALPGQAWPTSMHCTPIRRRRQADGWRSVPSGRLVALLSSQARKIREVVLWFSGPLLFLPHRDSRVFECRHCISLPF